MAVDVTGDGTADASYGPVTYCADVGCDPLGAADFDADGTKEVVIGTYFSIVDHLYFSIRPAGAGGYAMDPILVAPPGHPAAGIDPGKPLITSAEGDEGYGAWMRCEGFPEAPVLVWVWVYSDVDTNDAVAWHMTKLRLQDDGMFHVIEAADFTVPPDARPDFRLSNGPACGVPFNRWAAGI